MHGFKNTQLFKKSERFSFCDKKKTFRLGNNAILDTKGFYTKLLIFRSSFFPYTETLYRNVYANMCYCYIVILQYMTIPVLPLSRLCAQICLFFSVTIFRLLLLVKIDNRFWKSGCTSNSATFIGCGANKILQYFALPLNKVL